MPRIKADFTKALEEYMSTINQLSEKSEAVCKEAVYKGAQVVANQVRTNMNAIPTDEHWGTAKRKKNGPTKKEKKDITNGFGIAPIDNYDGQINTSVGFEGAMYNDEGKAILMLARSVNSGTSFMTKNPFFEKAVRVSKNKAKQTMIKTAEDAIEKITR